MKMLGRVVAVPAAALVCGAVLLLFALSQVLNATTPLHLEVQSRGPLARITLDGAVHSFAWSGHPQRLSLPVASPLRPEWGIDGSERLTLNNLDPVYLDSLRRTPYGALDLWLKGDESSDHWANLRLRDSRGRALTMSADPSGGFALPPDGFTFSVDLYRFQQPVQLRIDLPSGFYTIGLDRSGRSVTVTANPLNAPAVTVTQWYFPYDPWPFLGIDLDMIATAIAWAFLLLALAVLIGLLVPLRDSPGATARIIQVLTHHWLLPTVILGGSFALTVLIALGEYNGYPHILDGQAYLWQAKILASGHASLPSPPVPDSFPVPFFGLVNGHWVGQYALGNALTLVPGLLLGVPWLVQPLLGVGTLLLVGLIGQQLYGRTVALLAMLLGALSPLRSFLVGTYLSHIPAAFFIALAYYLLLRSRWGENRVLAGWAGAAAGMAFLCREVSTALVLLPPALLFVWCVAGRRRRWMALASFAIGTGVFLGLYLLYNWHITGNALISPRSILNGSDNYGFGAANHGWYFGGIHTPAAGLVNVDQLMTGLIIDLNGWPYYMSLAIALLPFVLARATRWDIMHGLMVGALLIGFAGYFYHGIIYGPRYYYEAVPLLLLLTARGIVVLGQAASSMLERLRRPRAAAAGPLAAAVLLTLFILPDLFFVLPRQLTLYSNFNSMVWMAGMPVSRLYRAAPPHAIIATSDWWVFANITGSLNDAQAFINPAGTRSDVWALASTPAQYLKLRVAFPHREVVLLTASGPTVTFTPWLAR